MDSKNQQSNNVDQDTFKNALKDVFRTTLDKSRDSVIASISKNKGVISKINEDIERLLISRNALLRDNLDLTSHIIGTSHFLNVKKEVLEKEFDEHHFDSDIVKSAVSKVRMLFFDDEMEIYQKYNCVDIKTKDYDSSKVSFIFSNGDREFFLNIPISTYGSSAIQDTESCGGGLYISFYRNSSFCDATEGTLSVSKFREDIFKFMSAKSVSEFKVDRCKKSIDTLPTILSNYMSNELHRTSCRYSCYENDNISYSYSTYR